MRRERAVQRAGPYALERPTAYQRRSAEDAGATFRKMLIGLYITEAISARKVCDMAHYYTLTNGIGMEDLALVPDPKNQNHNTFLKFKLGSQLGQANLTYVECPMHDKKKRMPYEGNGADRSAE